MENQTKNVIEVPAEQAGDRRSSRLVQGIPNSDVFAGWGPRMTGSIRDILRGLN